MRTLFYGLCHSLLQDKRTEELAVLDDVEKEHAKRVQLVTAGIDPAALKKGKPKKPKRGTTRISVTSWLPQKYAGTPEGHFAHVMKTKKGSPVRRSFAHDPYVKCAAILQKLASVR